MQQAMRRIHVSAALAVCLLGGGAASAETTTPSSSGVAVEEGKQVTVQYFIAVPGDPKAAYRDVAQFVQGKHEILPALEKQVAGMREGDEKQFQLSVDEGFGPYDESRKQTVEKQILPPTVKQGDIVGDKEGHAATVVQLSPTTAVLDFNHPLAGKPLVVSLKVLKVEGPTS
jgi:FKBP-type peptidyl-prolyl cis-trans isomerase 2